MIFHVNVDGKTYRSFLNVKRAIKVRNDFNAFVKAHNIKTGKAIVVVEF